MPLAILLRHISFLMPLTIIYTAFFVAIVLVFKLFFRNKKIGHIFLISLTTAFVLTFTVMLMFNVIYPTEYPFKDNEILGSTYEEVIKNYGEPDYSHTNDKTVFIAYGLKTAHSYKAQSLIWANDCPADAIWYSIKFDENKIAYEIDLDLQRGG